jgi:hypothetical protein
MRCWTTAAVLVAAMGVMLAAPALAGSVLEVNVSDVDGVAEGTVHYDRWNAEREAWEGLHNRNLLHGRDRIGLAPGTYRVRVRYTETKPVQEAVSEEIPVGNGESLERSFYFGKGTATFMARDNDWMWNADADVFIQTKQDDGTYAPLHSLPLPTLVRKKWQYLAPGDYRVVFRYKETRPRIETADAEFTIADGEVVKVLALFQHGPMPTRRKHDPAARTSDMPALEPNEGLTQRTDNTD